MVDKNGAYFRLIIFVIGELAFSFLYVLYTILQLVKFSIEWYIIVGVLFDYDGKSLLRKLGWVDFRIGSHREK